MRDPEAIAELIELLRQSLATFGQRLEAVEKIVKDYVDTASAAYEATSKQKKEKAKVEIHIPHDAEEQRRKEQESAQRTQKWIARGTCAAVIAASIYAGIAAYQIHEMRKESALEERAWTFPYRTAWGWGDDNTITANIGFRNTGKTPVTDSYSWFCIQARDTEPLPPSEDQPTGVAYCLEKHTGTIPPDEPFSIQKFSGQTADDETQRKLTNLSLRVYFWGQIRYRGFQGDWHYTNVCLRSEGTGRRVNPSPSTDNPQMGVCEGPHTNDAN